MTKRGFFITLFLSIFFLNTTVVYSVSDRITITGVSVKNFYGAGNIDLTKTKILVQNDDFRISFVPQKNLFFIVIYTGPFDNVKERAEAELLEVLDISRRDACGLFVQIVTLPKVSIEHAGKYLPLSFCNQLVEGLPDSPNPTFPYETPIPGEPTCDDCGKCVGSPEPPNYSACKACTGTEGNSWTPIGCLPNTASGFVNGVLRFLLPIASGFAFLGIIWGGFLLLTSKGEAGRIKRGRSILVGSIGALLLILFAVFLLRFIGFKVLGIPGFQ